VLGHTFLVGICIRVSGFIVVGLLTWIRLLGLGCRVTKSNILGCCV